MELNRTIQVQAYDDGLNAWEMARITPAATLRRLIAGYVDYSEHIGVFTTRRELPHPEGVLIVNLGEPIAIMGGDAPVLELGPGEAFAAGAHLRPALSHSSGAQAGVHVFLPLTTLRRLLGVPMPSWWIGWCRWTSCSAQRRVISAGVWSRPRPGRRARPCWTKRSRAVGERGRRGPKAVARTGCAAHATRV